MSNYISQNYSKWPYFDDEDILGVEGILRSGKTNRWVGSKNIEFEEVLSNYTGVDYSIAVANGTLALELALEALEIGQGDEVIVPCRTFIATASAVVVRGAKPIVADVELNSQNISVRTIEQVYNSNVKAIIVVHHAGYPCEMDDIMEYAKAKGIYVIEDCAQAHGGAYKGKKLGSIGDIGTFSFCQDKIVSTGGEGGAVCTNNRAFYLKMWSYKDHGRDYDLVYNCEHKAGFRWLLESFGTNMRMTEMQAYLGIRAYSKLDIWVRQRNENAKILNEGLSKFDFIELTQVPEYMQHAMYKYYFFVDTSKISDSLSDVIRKINELGIPAYNGTCWNISEENCFKKRLWTSAEMVNSAKIRDKAIMLLVHPTLNKEDMLNTVKLLEEMFASYC